ncbi:MAG: PD-(D/E)XK nuclease family protein [Spirochaetaceae bacterium]|nr:PD-(D/E)XK nuclease family protein [Spirochaetaceae bacterium]
MKVVIDILQKEIDKPGSRFVFPSETASSLWARKALELTGKCSLALDRFLAWDRFKEEAVRAGDREKKPATLVIRKLFVDALIRKNAALVKEKAGSVQEGLPFRTLIAPRFAEGGQVFAASIAAMLPSLRLLEEKRAISLESDDEDRDFAALRGAYNAFLERRGLFEPAWEKPPLKDRNHEYYIFFPEAMEDFAEYERLLCAEPELIHLVRNDGGGEAPGLIRYGSARAEIRALALELLRLYEEEKIPYEEMAVSVPGLETAAPYISRELSLYNIPYRLRKGSPLGKRGAGRLFSLIQNCVSENFSFASLKALLLNEAIPWKDPATNRALIEFGIKNNCVSGFTEHGRSVDVWTEAFKGNLYAATLGAYYAKLKARLLALCGAASFGDIRKHYFAFRGGWGKNDHDGFLSGDEEFCSKEADAALSRCIVELSALIELEKDSDEYTPGSPFNFFCSLLNEKQYVFREEDNGINIFDYRVAAASPFACHFIINAVQGEATVLYQPLKFLRPDKRKALGITDTDASKTFFGLSRGLVYTRISAADENFSGPALLHSFFAEQTKDAPPLPADSFLEEKRWWASGAPVAGVAASGAAGAPETGLHANAAAPIAAARFPGRLFPVQLDGFRRWRSLLSTAEPFTVFKKPFAGKSRKLLEDRVREIQMEGALFKVSATDLNNFFFCPVHFLFRKLFSLEPFSLEAKLLDDASRGILYHEILRRLFARIKKEDGVFKSEHIESYCLWALEYAREAAQSSPEFRGPLAAPILASQSRAMAKKVSLLLQAEEKYFSGFAVGELEELFEFQEDGILLKGKLDRVSISVTGEPYIVDYKTGGAPSIAESSFSAGEGLRDFQMAMYVKLYEKQRGQSVGGACFMRIRDHDATFVLGGPPGKRGGKREAYQETLDVLEEYTDTFRRALKELFFAPLALDFGTCLSCDYSAVCRTVFFLNSQKNLSRTEAGHGD